MMPPPSGTLDPSSAVLGNLMPGADPRLVGEVVRAVLLQQQQQQRGRQYDQVSHPMHHHHQEEIPGWRRGSSSDDGRRGGEGRRRKSREEFEQITTIKVVNLPHYTDEKKFERIFYKFLFLAFFKDAFFG